MRRPLAVAREKRPLAVAREKNSDQVGSFFTMILRLSTSAHRRIFVVVAFAVALFLSYFSIRNALAVHYASLQTAEGFERAARLEPADPRNWYLLGRYWQHNLENPSAQRAVRAYLSALSLNPRSSDAWLDLATVYESEGDLTAARDAFLNAKKTYPLSAEVAWRYGNFLLRQSEFRSAFTEMRRAAEADPRRAAEAFSRSLRVESDVDAILDRVLPPIGDAYVDVIRDQTGVGHTAIALKVWDRLISISPRTQLQDSFPLVGALMTEKQISEASRVWDQAVVLAGMTDLPGPSGSILWDGGFESGVIGGGFAWLFPAPGPDVQIAIDSQEKHSGNRSLRLMFAAKSNILFSDVCHYVPIQPSSSYRFSAWVRTQALTTDQGIRFQLRPLGTHDSSSAATPDVHGTQPWTRLELPWASGKDVHELQVCLLRLPSDQPEGKIQGTAWVDDVALVPEPAEHSQP